MLGTILGSLITLLILFTIWSRLPSRSAMDAGATAQKETELADHTHTQVVVATELATETPAEATLTPPATQVPTRTHTQIITLTATPLTGVIRELDTPLGGERKFVIHQVIEGENMVYLAQAYGTSEDAIQAVNFALQVPLWPKSIIVIPINQTDVTGVPAFQPVKVEVAVSLRDLAENLSLDLEQLADYNGLPPDYILSIGDWVLIPHNPTATTQANN
jgi:hypothetical protein